MKSVSRILYVVFISLAISAAGLAQSSAAFNVLSPPTASGGLIYGIGTNVYGNLPLGPAGDCLESNGTTLVWAPCTLGTGFAFGGDLQGTSTSQFVVGLQGRPVSGVAPATGQALEWNGTTWSPTTLSGFGTVTSVGLSLPSIFNVTSSPVTSSGTIAATLASQSANTVFAAPNGTAGLPMFRSLTGADLPSINLSAFGNGGVTGTLGVSSGGTGLTSVGASGQCLTSNGTAMAWGPCGAGTVTSVGLSLPAGFASSGTPVTGSGSLGFSMPLGWGNGSLLIGNGANSVTTLPLGSAGQCLVSNGATTAWGSCLTSPLPGTQSATAHEFMNSYNASTGAFTVMQPSFSDLSGTAAPSQLPLPTATTLGGIESAAPVAHEWVNSVSTSGTLASSQPAFSDISGTASFSQLPALSFGNITGAVAASQIAPSPVSGDCPQYNGATLVWAPCSALPSSWTVSGATGTLLMQPAGGQDAVVQQWMPSVSNPTADIMQAYLPGATPTTNCATNSKCVFAIQASGSLYLSGNSLALGSLNQPTASYVSLPGGTPGQGYVEFSSASLNPPAAPSVGLASGGSIAAGYATPVKITYVNGAGETLASNTTTAPATTSGNQAVVVTSPTPETNATGYNVYAQASGGNWYGPVNSSPVAIGMSYTINSISGPGGLPTANTTGGLYNTFLSMSAEGGGALCSSSSAPGQDCTSGTNLLTANNLIAGSNISITPAGNGNLTIASTGVPTGFSSLLGGTNTSAAMLVGAGASLGPTASGIVTANAYSGTVPNSNLPGSGSLTVNNALCALGSSCNPTGGTSIHTTSYTVALSDAGGMVVMNCSSACAVTLPNPQPGSKWYTRILSIGSTTATMALGVGMTWNGGSSAPILNSFRPLTAYADSTTSSNYYGEAPLAAGNNVTFTPSATGFTITANGGPVTTTHYIPLEACEPDQTGNSFYTVASETNWFEGHWELVTGQASAIYCRVRVPHTTASAPGANLVLTVSANDSTAGHTANFQTCDNVVSATINVGPLSCSSAQPFITTATALAPVTLSFPVQSTLAADEFLVVKIATSASGTAPGANMHVWPYLQINETE